MILTKYDSLSPPMSAMFSPSVRRPFTWIQEHKTNFSETNTSHLNRYVLVYVFIQWFNYFRLAGHPKDWKLREMASSAQQRDEAALTDHKTLQVYCSDLVLLL